MDSEKQLSKKKSEIFKGKSVENVFEDIYNNSQETKTNISGMFEVLSPLITKLSDAALIGPIIKDLVETSIKNDENLLKLVDIYQKYLKLEDDSDSAKDGMFSDDELKQLYANANELSQRTKKPGNISPKN